MRTRGVLLTAWNEVKSAVVQIINRRPESMLKKLRPKMAFNAPETLVTLQSGVVDHLAFSGGLLISIILTHLESPRGSGEDS